MQGAWRAWRSVSDDSAVIAESVSLMRGGRAGMGNDMNIQLIFRIAAVGILVSVLNQILKHSGREEQAFLASLAGLVLVLFWILPYIAELFETIQSLFAM